MSRPHDCTSAGGIVIDSGGLVLLIERYVMTLRCANRTASAALSPEVHLFTPRWADDLVDAEKLLTYESEKQFIRRAMGVRLA